MINVLFALFSILAGGILAEIAYIFLIIMILPSNSGHAAK